MKHMKKISKGYTSYLTATLPSLYDGENEFFIDLGVGRSPIGPAPELLAALTMRDDLKDLSAYSLDPWHLRIAQLFIEGYALEGIEDEGLVFSANGSFGAADEVIRVLSFRGYHSILAAAYSFPDICHLAGRHRLQYVPVPLRAIEPGQSAADMLQVDKALIKGSIVYLDYPNNPFGYADPALLRQVVRYTIENGGIPLVDLAFAEVLGSEFKAAIEFVSEQGGMCVGSLSKTQGLPGLRTGYAIMPASFSAKEYQRERMPFLLTREAEYVYRQLFEKVAGSKCLAQLHAQRVAQHNVETNRLFYSGLQTLGLSVGKTNLSTSLQVVIAHIPDFYQRMLRAGIICESLRGYDVTLSVDKYDPRVYGDSAVRVLTPGVGKVPEVIAKIKGALQG